MEKKIEFRIEEDKHSKAKGLLRIDIRPCGCCVDIYLDDKPVVGFCGSSNQKVAFEKSTIEAMGLSTQIG